MDAVMLKNRYRNVEHFKEVSVIVFLLMNFYAKNKQSPILKEVILIFPNYIHI